MKTLIQFLVTFLALLAAPTIFAALLQPVIHNQQLGFSLSEVEWPATFIKDLSSGFENRILIRVAAASNEKPIAKTDILIVEKYDLWDELFRIRLLVAGVVRSDRNTNHIEEVMAQLHSLTVANIFSLNALPQNQGMNLQVDILINPIDREKIERLDRWVAENSAPRLAGQGAATLTSRPNSLFNKIYDQYVHGADIAAPWRMTVISKSFVLQDLPKEAHRGETK